jgi:signal peptidase I
MKSLKRTGRIAANLGLAALFLGSVAFLLPSLLGYDRYVITSGSMTGTFDIGSIVFDKPVPVADLAVGDVITYQPPESSGIPHLVTHRIVSIRPSRTGAPTFRTQGDANPQRDPWIFQLDRADQAEVQFGVPYAGYLFLALADRHTRMLVIGIPAALIALVSLLEVARALRPERSEPRLTIPLTAD